MTRFAFAPAEFLAESTNGLTGIAAFVEDYKPLLSVLALAVVLTVVWRFFRTTWKELDAESLQLRKDAEARGETSDLRPFIASVAVAVILTLQWYYGGRDFFGTAITPKLTAHDTEGALRFTKYQDLYSYAWWSGTRIFGYVLPFALWKVFFRKDSVLDFGLRTKGFFDHAWIYVLFLAVVLPAMLVVARAPDFGTYYPFYKLASRSWFDFLTWEAMYFAQFFALEMFFRGFWLGALRRSFGSGAIFAMAVPYCMIHYGKPYLEACGAIVAGIALGSLSMKTKSIYQGFLVHVTVAGLMDWLALRHRNATPVHLWPGEWPAPPGEDARREAIASAVERTGGAVFAVLFLLLVVMILRTRPELRDRIPLLRRSPRL